MSWSKCLCFILSWQMFYSKPFNDNLLLKNNGPLPTILAKVVTSKAMLDMAKLWHLRIGHAPWCARFRAHLQPHFCVKSFYFVSISYTLSMISPWSCLRVFWDYFRWISEISRLNGVSSRFRHLSRSFNMQIESLTQSQRSS